MDASLEKELRDLLSPYSPGAIPTAVAVCACLRGPEDLPVASAGPREGCIHLRWEGEHRSLSVEVTATHVDWYFHDSVKGQVGGGEVTSVPIFSSVVLSGFLHSSSPSLL